MLIAKIAKNATKKCPLLMGDAEWSHFHEKLVSIPINLELSLKLADTSASRTYQPPFI